MAKQVISRLVDDIDGADATETVTFGFEGVQYEIDLSEDNAGKLRRALAAYVAAGTRVGRSSGIWRPGVTPSSRRGSRVDTKAVRAWAAENGHELSDRGRIPHHVTEAYEAAQKAPAAPPAKVAKASNTAVSAPAKVAKQAPRKKAAAVQFKAH